MSPDTRQKLKGGDYKIYEQIKFKTPPYETC